MAYCETDQIKMPLYGSAGLGVGGLEAAEPIGC